MLPTDDKCYKQYRSIHDFLVSAPSSPWLKFNGQSSVTGSTPSAVTVTADPTGLAAGTYPGSISVAGGTASNTLIPVTFTVSAIGVNPASLAFTYTVGSSTFPATQVLLSAAPPRSARQPPPLRPEAVGLAC